MGRATRWLRSLLGGKKESREHKDSYAASVVASASFDDRRVKKRWSFKSVIDSSDVVGSFPPWRRSLYTENENEQSKHAIAVAAVTAAAADAAVAAAQAAVAAVRLTSRSRSSMIAAIQERLAAVKIQTAFRGYLAKRALRALKALVKVQALVRGYLVRKQAAATFYSMQALVRAQATVQAQKFRALLSGKPHESMGRFYETRSDTASFRRRRLSSCSDHSPEIIKMDTFRPKSRSSRGASSFLIEKSNEILPCRPGRISIAGNEWSFPAEPCAKSSTAHSTPRCASSGSSGGVALPTPAKSVLGAADGVFRHFLNSANCPSYMAKTQSFKAKVRSQSAPKQRPDPAG